MLIVQLIYLDDLSLALNNSKAKKIYTPSLVTTKLFIWNHSRRI